MFLKKIPNCAVSIRFELFDIDNAESLIQVISALRTRMERRDITDQETNRLTRTFRKKLQHYEHESMDAVTKLRIIEPQLEKNQGELDSIRKDNKRLEKKIKVLTETNRAYELDRNEMENENRHMATQLAKTERQKRDVTEMADKTMRDQERRINADARKKLDAQSKMSAQQIADRDAKMSRLKDILKVLLG